MKKTKTMRYIFKENWKMNKRNIKNTWSVKFGISS